MRNDIIKDVRRTGHAARTVMINAYKILVGKSERNRSLERYRRYWDGSVMEIWTEVCVGLIWLRIGTGSMLL
jgi:hypothetical protein